MADNMEFIERVVEKAQTDTRLTEYIAVFLVSCGIAILLSSTNISPIYVVPMMVLALSIFSYIAIASVPASRSTHPAAKNFITSLVSLSLIAFMMINSIGDKPTDGFTAEYVNSNGLYFVTLFVFGIVTATLYSLLLIFSARASPVRTFFAFQNGLTLNLLGSCLHWLYIYSMNFSEMGLRFIMVCVVTGAIMASCVLSITRLFSVLIASRLVTNQDRRSLPTERASPAEKSFPAIQNEE